MMLTHTHTHTPSERGGPIRLGCECIPQGCGQVILLFLILLILLILLFIPRLPTRLFLLLSPSFSYSFSPSSLHNDLNNRDGYNEQNIPFISRFGTTALSVRPLTLRYSPPPALLSRGHGMLTKGGVIRMKKGDGAV